jgi:hypothetical protein
VIVRLHCLHVMRFPPCWSCTTYAHLHLEHEK